ncbi:MAG: hypothetical protein Q4C54_00660 [Clostridia bacterium]|nr:hypothetical protein [Clostridia bacterium]
MKRLFAAVLAMVLALSLTCAHGDILPDTAPLGLSFDVNAAEWEPDLMFLDSAAADKSYVLLYAMYINSAVMDPLADAY